MFIKTCATFNVVEYVPMDANREALNWAKTAHGHYNCGL